MAFFEDIAVRIGLDPKAFDAGVRAVLKQSKAVKDGLKDMGDGFNQVSAGIKTFAKNVAALAAATTALAAGIFEVTKQSADAADAAGKASERLGLTVEEYGRLVFAAKQAGLEQEGFEKSFVKFSQLVADAQKGDKDAIATLQKMAVRIKKNDGTYQDLAIRLFDVKGKALSVNQVFEQIATNVSLVGKGTETTTRAMDVFGKGGAKLIPVLLEGRKGLKVLGDEAERLGVVFTEEEAKIGDDFGDAVDRSSAALTGLRNKIGLAFAPALTQLADKFTEAVVRNRAQVVALAVQGFQFLYRTVSDLFHAFRGEDAQVTQQWVLTLRDNVNTAIETIKGAFTNVLFPLFATVKEFLDDIAQGINNAFGTNISGSQIAFSLFLLNVTGSLNIILGLVRILLPLITTLSTLLVSGIVKPLFQLATSKLVVGLFAQMARGAVALTTVIAAIIGWPATIAIAIGAAIALIVHYFDDIKAAFQSVIDFASRTIEAVKNVWSAGKNLFGKFAAGFSGAEGNQVIPGKAGGGLFRGAGTGTSDSNLVRLSDKEFVIKAASVKRWGVPFLDAINAGRLPAFANGGAVDGGMSTPVNLHLDGATFPAKMAGATADDLIRSVRAASRRKPGKQPSWKR